MEEFGLKTPNLVIALNLFLGMVMHAQKLMLAQMEKFGMYSHIPANALKLRIGMVINAKICHNVKVGKF
jgi:hypothetical protein